MWHTLQYTSFEVNMQVNGYRCLKLIVTSSSVYITAWFHSHITSMQVFVYLERDDFRHQKLTLEPSFFKTLAEPDRAYWKYTVGVFFAYASQKNKSRRACIRLSSSRSMRWLSLLPSLRKTSQKLVHSSNCLDILNVAKTLSTSFWHLHVLDMCY